MFLSRYEEGLKQLLAEQEPAAPPPAIDDLDVLRLRHELQAIEDELWQLQQQQELQN